MRDEDQTLQDKDETLRDEVKSKKEKKEKLKHASNPAITERRKWGEAWDRTGTNENRRETKTKTSKIRQ